MLEQCPKCYREGLEPKYHKLDDPKCIAKNYNTISKLEHLHYKCTCGYDFIKDIGEGKDI